MTDIPNLIESSSLGTPAARALRDSVPSETAARIVEASRTYSPDCTSTGGWSGHLHTCTQRDRHEAQHGCPCGKRWE